MWRNDDDSTGPVPIGFAIDFFGATYTTLYVNNNGNVTFDGPMWTYTPFPIITTGVKLLAPFFGDVDTRAGASDVTKWGSTTYGGRPAFCVSWAGVGVGYYSFGTDRLNNFQLVLVDRSDVGAGDFDIVFNYDRIQWETGGASGGSGGLGGSSARAGWSNGLAATYELAGSAINGGLLDSNATTGLIHNSLNSGGQLGRYVFSVRNGVVLPPTNAAPELEGVGPFAVDEGGSTSLTANATDADGDPLTYEWDLDDDGSYETSGQTVTFSAAGLDGPSTSEVNVRVSDGDLSDTAAADVDVANVAPAAALEAPSSVDVFDAFSLALEDAVDVAADTLEYRFDCGDGAGYGAWSASSSVSCATSAIGNRSVKGEVRDDDGDSAEYTASVAVVDEVAPTGSCELGTNAAGKSIPNASAGFRRVSGGDNYALGSIVIADSGSSFVSAPIPSGSTIKLTQDPDGPAADVRPAGGVLLAHITTIGDPILRITDSSGNVTELSCGNLPPR